MKHVKLFEDFRKLYEFEDEAIDFSTEFAKVIVIFPNGEEKEISLIGQVWKDENSYGFSIGLDPKDVPFVKTKENAISIFDSSDEDDEQFVEGEWDFEEVLSALNYEAVMSDIIKIKWTKELLESDEINLDDIIKSQQK